MRAGTVIADRFEVERLARHGGMGSVYRARDRLTGAPIALKFVREARGASNERFHCEASVLSELHHPAIVEYVAHGTTGAGELYLAMEWLEGEDLSDLLVREGRIDPAEAIALGERVAGALMLAHGRGIVHRDVKPMNLFLPSGDLSRVMLLDFGIAKHGVATHALTATGVVLGTPGYMAPEQVRGDKELDGRADVFALACVLFECVAGRPAFVAERAIALLAKLIFEEPPRLLDVAPSAPPGLGALLGRMFQKPVAARPDMATVVAELSALRRGTGALFRAPEAGALSHGEQKLVSVVFGAKPADIAEQPTQPSAQASEDVESVAARMRPFGAEVELLADGSVIATVAGRASAADLAGQAAACALSLRDLFGDLTIALATGRGVLGGALPVGDAIDRAAAMLRRAELSPRAADGAVWLDAVTAGLLDPRFDTTTDGDAVLLRGLRDGFAGTRTLLGKPTRCVGRERELDLLAELLDQCVTEPLSRAALVTGPPGIGKSRVRHEFLRRVAAKHERVQVWVARGDPMSAGSPFGLVAQALRGRAGILDGEPVARRREKLARWIDGRVDASAAARVRGFIGELMSIPFPDDETETLRTARRDPSVMTEQTRRAWEELLAAECEAHPTLLVLEDLHWGDAPSVRLVDGALRTLRDRPLMVLALARPDVFDVFPKLWDTARLQHVRLDGLSRKASEAMVREILGDAASPEAAKRISERAGGNAFFLEELIRAAFDGRGDEAPETVLATVQARLEALAPEARRVLRAASIFGETFRRGGLRALLGQEGAPSGEGALRASEPRSSARLDLDGWLARLEQSEVITLRTEAKLVEEREYAFRHALVRDAAYAALTEQDKRLGHRLAGAWLERTGELDALRMAEHFERGDARERAASFYLRAARQSLDAGDYAGAIARAHRGVGLGATGETEGAFRYVEAEALLALGSTEAALDRGRTAVLQLPRTSAMWFDAASTFGTACTRAGDTARMTWLLDEFRSALRHAGPGAAAVHASATLSLGARLIARYDVARELVDWAEATAAREEIEDARAAARIHHARALEAMHELRFDVVVARAAASVKSYASAGLASGAAAMRCNMGLGYMELGDHVRAEMALRDAAATAETAGVKGLVPYATGLLGVVLARSGRAEEGRAMLVLAIASLASFGDRRAEAMRRSYLARALVAAGDLEAAEIEARRAVVLAEPGPPLLAYSLATLGQVLLARGRLAEAALHARRGFELLERLGSVELGELLVRVTFAEALRAVGDERAAREQIARTRARLLESAERIGDPALRESFLQNVPENARIIELASGSA